MEKDSTMDQRRRLGVQDSGAALVMAGLVAEGTTIVDGARHILRGYEGFEEKLSSLGATVALGTEPALRH